MSTKPAHFGRRSSRRQASRRENAPDSLNSTVSSLSGSKDKNLILLQERVNSLQTQADEKGAWLRALQRNYAALSNLCASQAAKIRSLTRDMDTLRAASAHGRRETEALDHARQRVKEQEHDIAKFRERLDASAEKIKELEETLSEREAQLRDMDGNEDQLIHKLKGVSQARADVESKLQRVTRELDQHARLSSEKVDQLQGQIERMEGKVSDMRSVIVKHEDSILVLTGERNKALNRVKRADLDLDNALHELKNSRAQTSELRVALKRSKEEYVELSEVKGSNETNIKNATMALMNVNQKMTELKSTHAKEKCALEDKLEFVTKAKVALQEQFDTVCASRDNLEKRLKDLEDVEEKLKSLRSLFEISRREKLRMFEACSDLDEKVSMMRAEKKKLNEENILLQTEVTALRSEKKFLLDRVEKLEGVNKDMEAQVKALRAAKEGEKPIGWSDRMAELVEKVSTLQKKVFELEQEIQTSKVEHEKEQMMQSVKKGHNDKIMDTVKTLLNAEESDRRAFTCQQCNCTYRAPVTATCGHSFCKECVIDSEECPLCEKCSKERFQVFPNDLLKQMSEKHLFRMASLKEIMGQME